MDGIDIIIAGFVGDLREQAAHDAQRIAGLELEVESLRRNLKMLESFQQELIKVLTVKLGLTLPDIETLRRNYQQEQLKGDLSPLERLNITGFRLPPPE